MNKKKLEEEIWNIIDKEQRKYDDLNRQKEWIEFRSSIISGIANLKLSYEGEIKCEATDCLFNTNGKCGGTKVPIEIDINAGCKHYKEKVLFI